MRRLTPIVPLSLIAPLYRLGLLGSLLLLSACDCSAGPGPRGEGLPDAGRPGLDAGPRNDGGEVDVCYTGLDEDRDGEIDEGCECMPGEAQRCYRGDPALAGIGACRWGEMRCVSDFEFSGWDVCEGDGEPSDEACDGVDNNCDGTVDEGCSCVIGDERPCYTGPPETEGVGSCVPGVERCVETPTGSEWSGCTGDTGPGDELCDGMGDEDCDGRIDEGCTCTLGSTQSCYGGPPGTAGVGECRAGTQTCEDMGSASRWGACSEERRPGTEACTGGLDEDCDGDVDCADADCATSPACCTPYSETVPVIPAMGEILFLVDRSGSMDWPAVGTARTRWQELLDATGSVLPMLDALPMGLLMFPEVTGTAEVGNCMVAPSPQVPIALGTRPTIQSTLVAGDPRAGDTPTPQAFATAQSYLMRAPTGRERFAVLLTDGLPEPSCGATVPATETAIADLRARLSMDIFVIGIVGPDPSGSTSGIPALQDALNRFAIAGGRPRPGATRYYEATDGPALTAAMTSILAAATNCTFTLAAPPPGPGAVEVRQDGARVPASATNGYTLSGTTLEFHGSYCSSIQVGLVSTIAVSDGC